MEQETRIAVVGIIVENKEAVGEVNQILHDYSPYIIGRMGLPYEKKHVNIISVIVDAPADRISAPTSPSRCRSASGSSRASIFPTRMRA